MPAASLPTYTVFPVPPIYIPKPIDRLLFSASFRGDVALFRATNRPKTWRKTAKYELSVAPSPNGNPFLLKFRVVAYPPAAMYTEWLWVTQLARVASVTIVTDFSAAATSNRITSWCLLFPRKRTITTGKEFFSFSFIRIEIFNGSAWRYLYKLWIKFRKLFKYPLNHLYRFIRELVFLSFRNNFN